jgi:hypothetical protein
VRYLAVRGRQVVRMDSQRIAGIGSGVGNVGQADVLSDGGAAVVPEVRAAEGVEEAHCSAARRIVAAAGYQITWVTADETTSIGGVTALRATRWLVTGVEQWIGIEDPLEEVGVNLIDDAVHVEVSAQILRSLFAIDLKHDQVGRI